MEVKVEGTTCRKALRQERVPALSSSKALTGAKWVGGGHRLGSDAGHPGHVWRNVYFILDAEWKNSRLVGTTISYSARGL